MALLVNLYHFIQDNKLDYLQQFIPVDIKNNFKIYKYIPKKRICFVSKLIFYNYLNVYVINTYQQNVSAASSVLQYLQIYQRIFTRPIISFYIASHQIRFIILLQMMSIFNSKIFVCFPNPKLKLVAKKNNSKYQIRIKKVTVYIIIINKR